MSMVMNCSSVKELVANRNSYDRELIKRLETEYPSSFLDQVGRRALIYIPFVTREEQDIELGVERKIDAIAHDIFGKEKVVRGRDSDDHPFIAFRIDILDPESEKVLTEVVEVIFNHKGVGEDKEHKMGPRSFGKTVEGNERESVFPIESSTEDLGEIVKKLLAGKTVDTADPTKKIRLRKN